MEEKTKKVPEDLFKTEQKASPEQSMRGATTGVTRRGFITSVGVTGAALTVGGIVGTTFVEKAFSKEVGTAKGMPKGIRPVPPVSPPKKWDYKTNVLVVGSGIGGLMAAVGAIEEGIKDIVVLEKDNFVGGESRGAWFACPAGGKSWAKATNKKWDNVAKEKIFESTMKLNNYRPNPGLLWKFIEGSADAIDKLDEMGVKIAWIPLKAAPPTIVSYTPNAAMALSTGKGGKDFSKVDGKIGRVGLYCVAAERYCRNQGVKFILESPMTALVRDNDGKIVGTQVKSKEGETIYIKAKKVCISTGGFNSNTEMMEYYGIPQGCTLCPPTKTGDGIRVAQGVGAGVCDMRSIEACEGGIVVPGHLTQSLNQAAVTLARNPGLEVNKYAVRFCNEDAMYSMGGKHSMNQPEGLAFTIYDSGQVHKEDLNRKFRPSICEAPDASPYVFLDEEHYPNVKEHPEISYNHPELGFYEPYEDSLKRNIKEGKIKVADTIEGLARKLGLNPTRLEETVEEYNKICRKRKDPFGKRRMFLHAVKKPPFYGVKHKLLTWDTCGGIRINENMQVVNEKTGDPITGLFAGSGGGVGGLRGEDNPGAGPLSSCVTVAMAFGYNAGRNAAREILGKKLM